MLYLMFQHTVAGTVNPEEKSDNREEPETVHVKQEMLADLKVPVKHIVAVEASSSQQNSMPTDISNTDKAWNKLACHLCGQIFKTVSSYTLMCIV